MERTFIENVWYYMEDGATFGGKMGRWVLGIPGKMIGELIGGAFGIVVGVIDGWFECC